MENLSQVNRIFINYLQQIMQEGDRLETRNHGCYSDPFLQNATFTEFPLVTLRKTAWRYAISEMEWFFSGNPKCPKKLAQWWVGQLSSDGHLKDGYPEQFRSQSICVKDDGYYEVAPFDQIAYILDGLKNHPSSRRLVMSAWNTGEMANITKTNDNPNTPSTCHTTIAQFFVRKGVLHIKSFQRSADFLLGVSHNWVQSWAMLMYFAHHANLKVGSLTWMLGDAHIYDHPTHIDAVKEMVDACEYHICKPVDLIYDYSGSVDDYGTPQFLASDFRMIGTPSKPVTDIKPVLF